MDLDLRHTVKEDGDNGASFSSSVTISTSLKEPTLSLTIERSPRHFLAPYPTNPSTNTVADIIPSSIPALLLVSLLLPGVSVLLVLIIFTEGEGGTDKGNNVACDNGINEGFIEGYDDDIAEGWSVGRLECVVFRLPVGSADGKTEGSSDGTTER